MWKKQSGFTLIEMLVTIGILMIISSIGFATYSTFSRTQRLDGAAEELKIYFRLAQEKAKSGNIPTYTCRPAIGGEARFVGYFMFFAGSEVVLQVNCEGASPDERVTVKNYYLDESVIISSENSEGISAPPITALPLTGEFDFGNSAKYLIVTVTLSGSADCQQFHVDRGGSITDIEEPVCN